MVQRFERTSDSQNDGKHTGSPHSVAGEDVVFAVEDAGFEIVGTVGFFTDGANGVRIDGDGASGELTLGACVR
jgi:hypothetical protein